MDTLTLRIRDTEYKLEQVWLDLEFSKEAIDQPLTLSLFADSKDLSRAGFAINCIALAGIHTIQGIERSSIELNQEDEDAFNELAESVICEPGSVLELNSLKLVFGTYQNLSFDTTLEATCFRLDEETEEREENIQVMGRFTAKIRRVTEPNDS